MPPSRVFVPGPSPARFHGPRRDASRATARSVAMVGVCALASFLLAACQPVVSATPPSATPTPATPTPTPTTPTPSPTPTVDLSTPGTARQMLDRLLRAAGPGRLIMVELTTQTAAVSVLGAGSTEPVTWTYRDHRIQQADSDLQYVDQASFDLDD
ncbi:MAG: hypothetical protein KIT69_16035, partial [Propionibacteriaceae bacterium]|nr:hypothetical protein [Propionibacteriaceae bacterium]